MDQWRKLTFADALIHIGDLYEVLGLYGSDMTALQMWADGENR